MRFIAEAVKRVGAAVKNTLTNWTKKRADLKAARVGGSANMQGAARFMSLNNGPVAWVRDNSVLAVWAVVSAVGLGVAGVGGAIGVDLIIKIGKGIEEFANKGLQAGRKYGSYAVIAAGLYIGYRLWERRK